MKLLAFKREINVFLLSRSETHAIFLMPNWIKKKLIPIEWNKRIIFKSEIYHTKFFRFKQMPNNQNFDYCLFNCFSRFISAFFYHRNDFEFFLLKKTIKKETQFNLIMLLPDKNIAFILAPRKEPETAKKQATK
jgi:hypothetical protein